ncbi:hypothetical protein [Halobaculum sp. EA56]|uniref:hypothetical protein n=1 Tax=Halobaculum sp. EA56 TaxID=3421648 RepID=UPI003EBBE864
MTRTKVDDVQITERATELNVPSGGELSSTWICPEETFCSDGSLAAGRLAAIVADEGALSSFIDRIQMCPTRRDPIETVKNGNTDARSTPTGATDLSPIEVLDGFYVERAGGWPLIRASGTQTACSDHHRGT